MTKNLCQATTTTRTAKQLRLRQRPTKSEIGKSFWKIFWIHRHPSRNDKRSFRIWSRRIKTFDLLWNPPFEIDRYVTDFGKGRPFQCVLLWSTMAVVVSWVLVLITMCVIVVVWNSTQIDPLLTPRGKRLREGSRAVARQLTSDILPELLPPPTTASSPKKPLSAQGGSSFLPPPPPLPPLDPQDLEKVGNRVFNALQNRLQDGFKTMQSDMQNEPWKRIPERLTQQSRDLLKEANNIFAETPEGLQEPPYTVVQQGPDYEIRQYEAYQVASTTMGSGSIGNDKDKEDAEPLPSNQDSTSDPYSPAQNGAAFNTLAAYLFGANKEGVSMEMTTPVTTTMSGEMRFYLGPRYDGSSTSTTPLSPPEPLAQDESSTNEYWYGLDKPGQILIQDIPPARLAVRRFTGFATKGEVMRQKNALLAGLALDGVELDVPHGSTVPHVVFQYNPPYTLPVLRRNEIAVAVLPFMEEEAEAEAKSVQP